MNRHITYAALSKSYWPYGRFITVFNSGLICSYHGGHNCTKNENLQPSQNKHKSDIFSLLIPDAWTQSHFL